MKSKTFLELQHMGTLFPRDRFAERQHLDLRQQSIRNAKHESTRLIQVCCENPINLVGEQCPAVGATSR